MKQILTIPTSRLGRCLAIAATVGALGVGYLTVAPNASAAVAGKAVPTGKVVTAKPAGPSSNAVSPSTTSVLESDCVYYTPKLGSLQSGGQASVEILPRSNRLGYSSPAVDPGGVTAAALRTFGLNLAKPPYNAYSVPLWYVVTIHGTATLAASGHCSAPKLHTYAA